MKRILVTGGNKGIGLAISKALIQKGCFVFLGSRDVMRGAEAVKSLPELDRQRVEVVPLDVTDDASVKTAVEIVAAKCRGEPLFGLVNNAGGSHNMGTHAGFQSTVELNFGGTVRTTAAFLPLLAKDGRIVMVSSGAAPQFVSKLSAEKQINYLAVENGTDIKFSQIMEMIEQCRAISASSDDKEVRASAFATAGLGDGNEYGLSKACVNMYTTLLASENPSMKINACSPGLIDTDLLKDLTEKMGTTPLEIGAKPVESGAAAPLYLMLDETVPGSGWYFGSDALRSPPHLYREPGTPAYKGDKKFDAATTSFLGERASKL